MLRDGSLCHRILGSIPAGALAGTGCPTPRQREIPLLAPSRNQSLCLSEARQPFLREDVQQPYPGWMRPLQLAESRAFPASLDREPRVYSIGEQASIPMESLALL